MKEENNLHYGECLFCHQTVTVETPVEDKEEWDKLATHFYSCNESEKYRKQLKALEKVKENIKELFGESSSTGSLLTEKVGWITNGSVASITVDSGAGYKGKIFMTSKGAVKVERSIGKKVVMEEQYE